MTVGAISWSLGVNVQDPITKFVLVALAVTGCVDADGIYRPPPAEEMSRYTSLAERSVCQQLAKLEALGIIRERVQQVVDPRDSGRRRHARKLVNGMFVVTKKDIKAMLAKPCYICGAQSEHIDHIIPLVRGGRHGIGNMAGACARCNSRKGTKLLVEYNAYRR